MLRSKFYSSEQVKTIAGDFHNADLEPKEEGLLAFAKKVLNNSNEVCQQDIDRLIELGFSEKDILNIALTNASRSFFSRIVDTVGFKPPTEWLDKMEGLFGQDTYQALNVGRTYRDE